MLLLSHTRTALFRGATLVLRVGEPFLKALHDRLLCSFFTSHFHFHGATQLQLHVKEIASKQQMGYKCRIAAVLLLLLASIAALISVNIIQDTWKTVTYSSEFGIVIDSGSSRSNVYLYTWPGEKENETGVVTEIYNCRVNGGPISEMKGDRSRDPESWNAFQNCIANVTQLIPVEKHKTTLLFLGATAGMRLLRMTDEKRAFEIMANLSEYLSSLPFAFQNASIISGQEEGLYGWITVNYLNGNFLEKNLLNAYVRPNGAKTVGSMDLGGASTQIAFAIQGDNKGPDYMPIKLYGYDYNVYTHSFLCYGKNEAEKMILDKIIQLGESSGSSTVSNPCYPDGFNITVEASSIYDTECTTKPKNYDPDEKFLMVGNADLEKCRNIVKSVFDFKTCSSDRCSFNGVEQPPVTGDFMAYAGFFYTARALLINQTSELDEYNASVATLCNTHWKVLRAEKYWISDKYLKSYCYASQYIFTLLADGYKFDNDTWRNIYFEKEIKKTSIGWSLGYMLSMSNMIPSEVKQVPPLTNPVFAGLIFLFSALTIVTAVFVFIILVRACF